MSVFSRQVTFLLSSRWETLPEAQKHNNLRLQRRIFFWALVDVERKALQIPESFWPVITIGTYILLALCRAQTSHATTRIYIPTTLEPRFLPRGAGSDPGSICRYSTWTKLRALSWLQWLTPLGYCYLSSVTYVIKHLYVSLVSLIHRGSHTNHPRLKEQLTRIGTHHSLY